MQLIGPLASGIVGAPGGKARICIRGSSVQAQVFSDFYGTVLSQPPDGLQLDSNGGVAVYVDRLVDITVVDASNQGVRAWTDGHAAQNVEYIGNSFTGQDYETGETGTLLPVTVHEILERVVQSFGAVDWLVNIGGVDKTLENALGVLVGLYVNVKSPEYGAVGDGVVDDGTAINAAMADAALTGATVFFPAGTYITSAGLTLKNTVSMLGGGDVTIRHTGAGDFITMPDGGVMIIDGLDLRQQVGATGGVLVGTQNFQEVRLSRCSLGRDGGASQQDVIDVSGNSCVVILDEVDVWIYGLTNRAVLVDGAGSSVNWQLGLIHRPASRSNGSSQIRGNNLTIASVTGGAAVTDEAIIEVNGSSGARASVTQCVFQSGGAAVFYAIRVLNGNDANTRVTEALNTFTGTWNGKLLGFQANSNNPQMYAGSREGALELVTDNTTPLTLRGEVYGTSVVRRTTAAAQTLACVVGPPGAFWTVVIFNNSGGVLAATTFGTGFLAGTPNTTTLANNGVMSIQFRAVVVNGSGSWMQVSPQQVT